MKVDSPSGKVFYVNHSLRAISWERPKLESPLSPEREKTQLPPQRPVEDKPTPVVKPVEEQRTPPQRVVEEIPAPTKKLDHPFDGSEILNRISSNVQNILMKLSDASSGSENDAANNLREDSNKEQQDYNLKWRLEEFKIKTSIKERISAESALLDGKVDLRRSYNFATTNTFSRFGAHE